MHTTPEKLVAVFERPRVFALTATIIGAIGLALRALWVSKDGRLAAINSEMLWVSRAFATTGQLADAYGPGTGRTAHVAPVMPIVAGAVYRLFGPTSVTAEIVLIVMALTAVGLCLWATDRVMARLGSPAIARLSALAVFCLAPLNFSVEMENFRVWEGAVAAAGLMGALAFALRRDAAEKPPGWGDALLLALGGGVMALISPPTALAIYGLLGLLAWRRRGFLAVPLAAALCVVLLIAVSYPWAVRNEGVFGEKVWSRTNFGFNFALGFHDGAIAPTDPKAAFVKRLGEVDPYTSKAAYNSMKAMGGEQAYSKMWSAKTKAWIVAHPAGTARIAARHFFEFYFPPRWFWSVYSDKATAVAPRQAIIWGITLLAGLGLAWRLVARDFRYLYLLAALTLPAAPYLLAQPILRYRYTVLALLTYLAADLVWRAGLRAMGTRPSRGEEAVASARSQKRDVGAVVSEGGI